MKYDEAEIGQAVSKTALILAGGDIHRAVSATSIAVGVLVATMVKTSTTPDASADPAMTGIDATVREVIDAAGVKVSPPPMTVAEQLAARDTPAQGRA